MTDIDRLSRKLMDLPDKDWDALCRLYRERPEEMTFEWRKALMRAGQVRPLTGYKLTRGYRMGFHSGYGNAGDA